MIFLFEPERRYIKHDFKINILVPTAYYRGQSLDAYKTILRAAYGNVHGLRTSGIFEEVL